MAICFPSVAQADLVFSESFDTDTSTTAQTVSTFSLFSFTGGSDNQVSVINGVLHLPMQPTAGVEKFSTAGFAGDLTINLDLGKDQSGPFFYTGLVVGDNRLLFHSPSR